jgi:2-polyprenyl-6-methoxyphenol hydroxylase-like FAD-dependent oxidoreductase
LIVAADGRASRVRNVAGIPARQVHISGMTGYLLKNIRLPEPGFGHVFADGRVLALAYAVSANETRIMLDTPLVSNAMPICIEGLPLPLRSAVEDAIRTQTPLRSANYSVVPERIVKGRLACVGDAGGCCHPVTATGLSASVRDAVLLRDALAETAKDVPRALQRYASAREGPQRARMTGAAVLYEVLTGSTAEMSLLRRGLLRYWQCSPEGRAATMALLATHEDRMSAVIREYMQVCRYALPELVRSNGRARATVGLSRAVLKTLGRGCGIQ